MFVQLIQGTVADRTGLERQLERWNEELRPGAPGHLASTGGFADDGTAVLVHVFDSLESAAASDARPEQEAWWRETTACFDHEPVRRETTDLFDLRDGDVAGARFVQVITGRARNRDRIRHIYETMAERVHHARPDILGEIVLWFGDDFAELVWFTSEDEARIGEKADLPHEVHAANEEVADLLADVDFIDLRQPLLLV